MKCLFDGNTAMYPFFRRNFTSFKVYSKLSNESLLLYVFTVSELLFNWTLCQALRFEKSMGNILNLILDPSGIHKKFNEFGGSHTFEAYWRVKGEIQNTGPDSVGRV